MSNPSDPIGPGMSTVNSGADDPVYAKPEGAGQPIHLMSDRELSEEMVWQLRSVGKMLDEFKHMGPGDIMKLFMPGKK